MYRLESFSLRNFLNPPFGLATYEYLWTISC